MNLLKKLRSKEDQEDKHKGMDPSEMPEPDDFSDYMRRGWAYHSQGQQEQAERDFQNALKLDPESVDARTRSIFERWSPPADGLPAAPSAMAPSSGELRATNPADRAIR